MMTPIQEVSVIRLLFFTLVFAGLSFAQVQANGRRQDCGNGELTDLAVELMASAVLPVTRSYSFGIVSSPDNSENVAFIDKFSSYSQMSLNHKITLSLIASSIGPVSAGPPPFSMTERRPLGDMGYALQPELYATHTFANAPALDILLVPGGRGNVALSNRNDTSLEDFVARRFSQLEYLLSVCTGAATLAKAGVLNGKRATTNKGAWTWVTQWGKNVTWVPSARWTEDGNIWASSGVAAGE
ncbi:hypothetical protein IFR05_001730 [Cadophora sp. M221]|nr:hypothetical protein IFR05_001730 [Cadophora sp. M221]